MHVKKIQKVSEASPRKFRQDPNTLKKEKDRKFNESKKSEMAPDDYAMNSFLEDALDYAEIKDDNGNVTLLKFYKNKYSDDFKLDSYDGENEKTLAVGGLRYVVDRYGELLDMEPAEAIIEIAKE